MAAEVDLTIFDNRDVSFIITWFDDNDVAIDVTGFGAMLVVKEDPNDEQELIKSTEADDITVGTTDGKFTIAIPRTKTQNLGIKRGVWEFTVYPGVGLPGSGPIVLISGSVQYRKTLAFIE